MLLKETNQLQRALLCFIPSRSCWRESASPRKRLMVSLRCVALRRRFLHLSWCLALFWALSEPINGTEMTAAITGTFHIQIVVCVTHAAERRSEFEARDEQNNSCWLAVWFFFSLCDFYALVTIRAFHMQGFNCCVIVDFLQKAWRMRSKGMRFWEAFERRRRNVHYCVVKPFPTWPRIPENWIQCCFEQRF